MLLAKIDKRHESVAYLAEFGGILLVGKLYLLERAARVDKIARIDAHLLYSRGRRKGCPRIEMHISHKRHRHPELRQSLLDRRKILSLAHTLGGEAHYTASGIGYTFYLSG